MTSGGTEIEYLAKRKKSRGGSHARGGVNGRRESCMGTKSTSPRAGSQQTMPKVDKMRNNSISILVKDREITTQNIKTEVRMCSKLWEVGMGLKRVEQRLVNIHSSLWPCHPERA